MILLIIEVIMFFSGVWALATGKLPAIVLGTKYSLEGIGARMVGGLLALPLPLAFMAGLVLVIVLGPKKANIFGALVELVTVVVALMAARITSRHFHKATLENVLAHQ